MEAEASNLSKKPNGRLPPKRGRILIGILKGIFGSLSNGARRRENEGAGVGEPSLSPSPSTPAATPSGYNSDAPSES